MTQDLEARIRRQAELDADIERSIVRDRRRRRRSVVILSIASVAVAIVVAVGVMKKVAAPSAGVEDFYTAALSLREKGELNAATRELRRVLALNPGHAEARWILGITLNEVGDGRGGEKELRQARMLGRNDTTLTVALLESLLLQRRYTEVLVETVSSGLGGDDLRLLLMQGEAQMSLAQYEKSRKTFRRALGLNSESVPVLLAMIRLSLVTDDLDGAEGYLQRAQKLDAGRPETRVLAGRLALAQNAFTLAREIFRAAPGEGKLTPEISLGVAQAFLAEGRPDAAGEYLAKLKDSVGPVAELNYLSGVAAIQMGELSTARTFLLGLLKESPEHIDGLLLMAWVNYAREEYRQAENSLNRLLAIDASLKNARLLLANVQLELAEPENAIKNLSVAEEQAAGDPQLLALLARAYMQANRVEEAEEYLQRAAENSSSDSKWLGTEQQAWEFKHCDSLIHYCRQCLYLRECR